jgi:hypothetical protein
MAQSAWPFENIDTSESQFSQWARNIGEGVKGSSGGTELKVYGDSSGMQVKVPAGFAMVRGHYYSNTALETLTIAAAHATLARIDSVILELDPSANTILLTVLTGTAASTPAAPTLTQTDTGVYQIRLANVAVAAAATTISAGNVTDTRTFLGAVSVTWDSITGKPTSYSSAIITTAVSDKSANYSILAGDKNTFIRSTGSAITITVDNVLSQGESIQFIQAGAGQITFVAGTGVTLYSADSLLKTAKQYAGATVVCAASGIYYLIGNLG